MCQSEFEHEHANILMVPGPLHYLLHSYGCAQSVVLISHPWHGCDISHVNRDCMEGLLVSDNSSNAGACSSLQAFQADRKWVTAGKVNIINPRGAGREAWQSAWVRKSVRIDLYVCICVYVCVCIWYTCKIILICTLCEWWDERRTGIERYAIFPLRSCEAGWD